MVCSVWRGVALAALLTGLTACAGGLATVPHATPAPSASLTSASSPQPTATASAVPTLTPTATPSATPSPINTPTHAPTPTPSRQAPDLTAPRLVVLAEGLAGPDDLLLAPDGSIYLSDVSEGTIKRFDTAGKGETILGGLSAPEGMVLLPDGGLVIAEQGKNRLLRLDPATKALTPLLALSNKTGHLGVDGLALDRHGHGAPTLIIPDSPNGTLLRASLDGKTVTTIARGFVRPTGAWVEADGSILVVDEDAGALSRVRPDGAVVRLAAFLTPDDCIADEAGQIYISTLGDGAIHLLAADTLRDVVLVNGLASPQGVILDGAGNLVVADAGHHRLVRVILHPN